MAITKDQVFEAAESLVGVGEEPTYITVRERLGSGSFSTISKYLREWKTAAGKGKDEGVAPLEIPAEFRSSLERFGGEVWRTLGAFAKTEIEVARTAFEERMRERDEELEKAAATVDALQSELEEATVTRDRLQEEVEAFKGELRELKGKSSELQASLTSTINEKFRLQEEVRDLDRTLSKTREQVTTLEGRVESLTAENLSLQADLNRRLDQIAKTREERDLARSEVLAASKVEENLRRELSKEEERGKELSAKVDDLSAKLTEETAKRAALEERLSQMEGRARS
jgi:chromosome segregation ATPase